jgi:hypothetical protein
MSQQDLRPSTDTLGRTIIYVDDVDFVTMHNILYFLYTGCVHLHHKSSSDVVYAQSAGYPPPVDASALYHAANMYLLEPLEERCYRYLTSTCTLNNICERLFRSVCAVHEKLKDKYFEYIVQNYDAVKMTQEWKNTILNISDGPPEEVSYRLTTVLLELSKMTFGVQ